MRKGIMHALLNNLIIQMEIDQTNFVTRLSLYSIYFSSFIFIDFRIVILDS